MEVEILSVVPTQARTSSKCVEVPYIDLGDLAVKEVQRFSTSTPKKRKIEEKPLSMDTDLLFFINLMPDFKRLTSKDRREFKLKILETLYAYFEQYEDSTWSYKIS